MADHTFEQILPKVGSDFTGDSNSVNRVPAKYFFPNFKIFKAFSLNAFKVFGETIAYFEDSSEKFYQTCTCRFRNFGKNFNIGRFSNTRMGDLTHFEA